MFFQSFTLWLLHKGPGYILFKCMALMIISDRPRINFVFIQSCISWIRRKGPGKLYYIYVPSDNFIRDQGTCYLHEWPSWLFQIGPGSTTLFLFNHVSPEYCRQTLNQLFVMYLLFNQWKPMTTFAYINDKCRLFCYLYVLND